MIVALLRLHGQEVLTLEQEAKLVGLNLQTTFLITDPAEPSTVGMISNTVEVRIVR